MLYRAWRAMDRFFQKEEGYAIFSGIVGARTILWYILARSEIVRRYVMCVDSIFNPFITGQLACPLAPPNLTPPLYTTSSTQLDPYPYTLLAWWLTELNSFFVEAKSCQQRMFWLYAHQTAFMHIKQVESELLHK